MHTNRTTAAKLVDSRPLAESLTRRIAIEEQAELSGKTFRRHARRMVVERLVVKPLLRAVLGATGLWTKGVQNALEPLVTRLTLEYPHLPPAFDGYQILHLSDLHIDCLDRMAEVVSDILESVQADLCLMTGDYRFETEGPCDQARAGMDRVVASVSAPDGIFGILGNHDPSEMAYALDDLGVKVLINDAFELRKGPDSLWLAGTDDPYDYRCDELPRALEPIPADAFTILLAHAPDLYHDASESGVDLYLSGHTHAGQVRLPWIGSVIQNSDAPRAYTHGYWRHANMHGYTSAGVGCSMLPIRFNCPPEIVLIELRASR